MRILVSLPMSDSDRRKLEAVTAGHGVILAERTIDSAVLNDADVALGNLQPALLPSAPRLRWLQLASTGVDAYRSLDWAQLGKRLVVTNLRGVHAIPVAETCIAGLLALHRGIAELVELKRQHQWVGAGLRPGLRELHGARVVILGAGAIAQRFADILAAFSCEVTLYGRTSGDIHTLDELDALLPHADIVCSLLPGTPNTQGLLDAARLARLNPRAILINAGRGSVLDNAALLDGIRAGRLAGAVLDVTADEPLDPDDPLWDCPNVVLTQHTAGGSDREPCRIIDVFAANLSKFLAGAPMMNVVDWTREH